MALSVVTLKGRAIYWSFMSLEDLNASFRDFAHNDDDDDDDNDNDNDIPRWR
jgi:hypothetical protein